MIVRACGGRDLVDIYHVRRVMQYGLWVLLPSVTVDGSVRLEQHSFCFFFAVNMVTLPKDFLAKIRSALEKMKLDPTSYSRYVV